MKIVRIVILSGIAVVLAVSGAFCADEIITAAVLDLDAKEGVSAGVVSTVTDYLRTQLVKTNKFNIVTRENMESILKEQQFQLSGCTSQECIVQMGQLLGVRNMFTGSIGKVGSIYIINLKLINVQSGKIDKADAEEAYSEDQLLLATRNLASKMAGLQTTPIASPQAAAAPAPAYSYAQQPAAAAPVYTPYVPTSILEKSGIGTYWSMWEVMGEYPGYFSMHNLIGYGVPMVSLTGSNWVPAISLKFFNSGTGSNDVRFDFAFKTVTGGGWGTDMHSLTLNIIPASFHLVPDMKSPVQPYIDVSIDMWLGWGEVTGWLYDYFDIAEGIHAKFGVEFFAGPVGMFFEGGVGVQIMELTSWEDAWGDSQELYNFFEYMYFPINFGARVYF